MRVCCELCGDIATNNYKEWVDHLISEIHQENTQQNVWSWKEDLNYRSLVVTGRPNEKGEVGLLHITLTSVAWHFSKYGMVSDLFAHPGQIFFIVQLEKREQVNEVLNSDPCNIQGISVMLRPKADLSPEDWFNLSSSSTGTVVEEPPNDFLEAKQLWYSEHMSNLDPDMQLEKFIKLATMSASDFEKREKIRFDLSHLMRKEFGNTKVQGLGDVITGLGDSMSTLTVYIDIGGVNRLALNKHGDPGDITSLVEGVYRIMLAAGSSPGKFCKDILLIKDTVPYIKLTHCLTEVTVELRLESVIPVYASKLIQFIISLDPRVLSLMLIIRYWAAYNIQPINSISNYTLELLAITFLNSCKILPNVAFLQSKSTSAIPLVEKFWNVNFCADYEEITEILAYSGKAPVEYSDSTGKPTASSILLLAKNFFQMYATADLKNNAVCSLLGNLIPKEAFDVNNTEASLTLPRLLHPYKNWALLEKSGLNIESPMCVQDPFNLAKNVASNVTEATLLKFQKACRTSVPVFAQLARDATGGLANLMDFATIGVPNDSELDVRFEPGSQSENSRVVLGKRPWMQQAKPSATVTSSSFTDYEDRQSSIKSSHIASLSKPNMKQLESNRQKSLVEKRSLHNFTQFKSRLSNPRYGIQPERILRNPEDIPGEFNKSQPARLTTDRSPIGSLYISLNPQHVNSTSPTGRNNHSPISKYPGRHNNNQLKHDNHVRSTDFRESFQRPETFRNSNRREDLPFLDLEDNPLHRSPQLNEKRPLRLEAERRLAYRQFEEAVPVDGVETYELRIRHVVHPNFAYCFNITFSNIASPMEIDLRCSNLWACFLKDYFTEIWETSFKLTAKLCDPTIILSKLYENRSNLDIKDFYSESDLRRLNSMTDKRHNRSLTTGNGRRHEPAHYGHEDDEDEELDRDLMNAVYHMQHKQNFREYHPLEAKFAQLSHPQKFCISFLVEGFTDIFTESALRLRPKIRREARSHLSNMSPLEKEGLLTQRVEQCLRQPRLCREFIATAKVDLTRQPPELLTIFTETPDCSGMEEVFYNMTGIMKGCLNQYQTYRLERWLH